MISIRTETPAEHLAVRQVIVAAFAGSEYGHNGEAEIVERLRADCDDVLSLVAVADGEVVAHIFFSPVSIGDVLGMGLAPMAVAPDDQRSGVGTALVEAGLQRLAADGCPFVVVLGHPDYYPRFGFSPAAEHGITHGFDGIPQDVFFVKFLDENAKRANGTARFQSEFGPQDDSE